MDEHDKNLKRIADLLRAHRPAPTPLQLDEVKRRAMGRGAARKPGLASWRARLVLAAVFVLAFAVSAFAVPSVKSVVKTATGGTTFGNSSVVEYCAQDNGKHQQCQPRMTGGGTGTATIPSGVDVHHGFELRCDVNNPPNRLEVNWGPGSHFHLDTLTTVMCLTDPAIAAPPPDANWNTYYGKGTGKLNGNDTGTAEWCFQDGGEPGGGGVDTFTLKITDSKGNVVLFFTYSSNQGNHQAHGNTTTQNTGTCPAITASSTSTTTKKKK